MLFITSILKKIVVILQTDVSPNQVAAGAAFGVFLGLVPGIVMKCLIFFFIMVLRVNIGSAFILSAIFAIVGLASDAVALKVGYFALNIQFLIPLWTALYNAPLVIFTKFNNTSVMGNFIIAVVLFAPVFFAAKKFIFYYRSHLRDKVAKWKITKLLTAGNLSYRIIK